MLLLKYPIVSERMNTFWKYISIPKIRLVNTFGSNIWSLLLQCFWHCWSGWKPFTTTNFFFFLLLLRTVSKLKIVNSVPLTPLNNSKNHAVTIAEIIGLALDCFLCRDSAAVTFTSQCHWTQKTKQNKEEAYSLPERGNKSRIWVCRF